MRTKYKISLLTIAIFILLFVGVEIHYQAYMQNTPSLSAFIKVTEGLSINYLDGTNIKVDKDRKEVSFSITNQLETPIYYDINVVNISGEQKATYRLTSNSENFKEMLGNLEVKSLASRVKILPHATEKYTLEIINLEQANFSFELEVKSLNVDNSFANTILNQNEIKESPMTTFNQVAVLDEGLIKGTSTNGSYYYFRGNVSNNYVSFAGNMWRILRINEDNSVKLILDGTSPNLVSLNTNEQLGNTDFLTSNMYQNLSAWYTSYLQEYDNDILSTMYCLDNSLHTNSDGRIDYLSHVRLFTDYAPSVVCGGTNVTAKIGLITGDEVVMAGGSNAANQNYFLYIPNLEVSWWTMTPMANNNGTIGYMAVNKDGALEQSVLENSSLFMRPVITLTRRVTVTGDGTLDNPYTLK